MALVIASGEISGGNVLSFTAFPTAPYLLSFVISFHRTGDIKGEISYRVRKWEEVIHQTEPTSLNFADTEGGRQFKYADSVELVLPSQGSYQLDILVDNALLLSLPFSVFDKSDRSPLEAEIVYYLRAKGGAKAVDDIVRGVFNPDMVNKANIRELSAKVYFALLRMSEVTNIHAEQQGNLEAKLISSRWKLK